MEIKSTNRGTRHDTMIVWIRNELRVQDHLALYAAVSESRKVVPLYIMDENFLSSSSSRRNVILSTLRVLREDLRSLGGDLFIRMGEPHECLFKLIHESGSAGVHLTGQDDPETRLADVKLSASLSGMGKLYREFKDQVLFRGEEILNTAGEPYRVYSAYRRAWLERSVDVAPPLPSLKSLTVPDLVPGDIPAAHEIGVSHQGIRLPLATEKSGLVTLNGFLENRAAGYRVRRDLLAQDGTSRISHHLSIGSLGVRTLYRAISERMKKNRGGEKQNPGAGIQPSAKGMSGVETFLNQIIWREFYKQILANFPHVVGGSFRREFDSLSWKTDAQTFRAWTDGLTGYPIVDAAMRQLGAEGWMHNRGRMIVASFLTKDLHIDWRKGEEHFMKLLADGDLALNNGGWQWSAGTGTDAQPWYRIFNPTLQGKKFDPDGEYVKRYVPELQGVPRRFVHEPWKMSASLQRETGCVVGKRYPKPIVDHDLERKLSLEFYKMAAKKPGIPAGNAGRMPARRIFPLPLVSA